MVFKDLESNGDALKIEVRSSFKGWVENINGYKDSILLYLMASKSIDGVEKIVMLRTELQELYHIGDVFLRDVASVIDSKLIRPYHVDVEESVVVAPMTGSPYEIPGILLSLKCNGKNVYESGRDYDEDVEKMRDIVDSTIDDLHEKYGVPISLFPIKHTIH